MTKVFSSLPLEDRDRIARLVAENAPALEKELRVVDPGKGRGKWGPMDLLAVDGRGRPVIIDVCPRADDELLVEGLAHLGWFGQYRHQISALLSEKSGELLLHPRLILVAPDFSTRCQQAAAALEGVAVDLIRLRPLEADGEEGLLVESIFSTQPKEPQTIASGLAESLPARSVPLNEEEILSFLKMRPGSDL